MPMLNVFDSDAFGVISLTQAINRLPNNYGRLRELNLMPGQGVRTRTIMVDEKDGVLNLLPILPVGSPGTVAKAADRRARSFVIPHIPHDAVILPSDVDGIRAFGQETQLETVATVMNDKLQQMRNAHAITLEFLRLGALKGEILGHDLSVVYDLFAEFEITKKSIDFELDVDTTDVAAKCREVLRHIEKNLKGDVMSGVRALVDETFFDNLISHANVEKFYLNHVAALNLAGSSVDPRKGFAFAGIIFEEYGATATDPDGTARKFITTERGHAFPVGTMSTFQTLFAPADMMETVNTIGLPVYAKQEPRKFNRGTDIHTQSNPLPICYRPEVLVELKDH